MDLRVSESNIYEKCLAAIKSVLNEHFPDDKSVFYDGGKYFARSLEYYAAKPIPHQEFEYQNHITDTSIAISPITNRTFTLIINTDKRVFVNP